MKTIKQMVDELELHCFFDMLGHPLENFKVWRDFKEQLGLNANINLYQVEDGWLEVFTGKQFYFMKPTVDMIDLEDIARALSNTARYNGHTIHFYSVAEHCVVMADLVASLTGDYQLALTALLHDSAEAYIGDLPRPVKYAMPIFKAMEERIDAVLAERFGTTYPFPDMIKEFDARILQDERTQIMNPSINDWGTDSLKPLGVTITGWSPIKAYNEFMAAFRMYNNKP